MFFLKNMYPFSSFKTSIRNTYKVKTKIKYKLSWLNIKSEFPYVK